MTATTTESVFCALHDLHKISIKLTRRRYNNGVVIYFDTNRKHLCNYFLLVVNSNLVPILPRFKDCRFSVENSDTNHLLANFGISPWTRLPGNQIYCSNLMIQKKFQLFACNSDTLSNNHVWCKLL